VGERKNQSTLTANEKASFVAAVLQLKANGRYDQYVRDHRDAMQSAMMPAHGGSATPASVINHRSLGYWYDTDPAPAPTQPSIIDLIIGAQPAQASIGQAGEVDLYRFVVPSVANHIIETQGQTDVIMSLFGPNSQTALVTEDDDSGQDRNVRIASRLTAGTYFVRVRHYQTSSTGSYSVSVRREAAAPGPAPAPGVPEIQVNGPAVQGSLAAANESDLYTFTAASTAIYTIETAGNTDTFLTLFGPNSQTALIAQDDDSAPGFNSRIEADLAAGVYFARVRHYSPTGTGPYSVSVRR